MSNDRICRYFASTGHCKFGEKCYFVHSTKDAPASPVASTSAVVQSSSRRQSTFWRSKQPCRFFLQGNCHKGDQCEWSHEFKAEDLVKKEANATIQRIALGASTLVTYVAGLQVQHIVCGFDCLYITIKNLPQDVDRAEVEELFTQQGVAATSFYVERIRTFHHKKEARVIIETEIGESLAVGLDGTEFRDDEILDVAVDHDSGPRKMGSSGRNTNVLTVSWKIPTSTILVECHRTSAAQKLVDKLHNTIKNGRTIQAVLHDTYDDEVATCVKVSGLSPNAASAWVRKHPDRCTLTYSFPCLDFDTKAVEKDLRRHVERRARIESFEVSPLNPNKVNAEVRIRFHSWDDAKRVLDTLKAPLNPGYPKFHLWLPKPKPIQFYTKIPLVQYHAQKTRWDSISERDDNKAAFVRIADNNRDFTSIRVLGEDKKAVGQLKVRVENLILGETLDASLWHRSFLSPTGRRFLENVSARTKTYVWLDWKTKSLKLCADGHAKEAVLGLIEAEVERLKNSETSITINQRAVGFFLRQGIQALKEELGDDAVTLELTSPPQLLIRGGEEAHRIVDRLIAESKTGYRFNAGNGEGMCPVCFDDATTPVLLACKHAYCSECIRHYLMSASERKQFPLACAGDEDRCKVPIAIPVIQRFLSQQLFEELLDAAVTSYIEKQPAIFQYCKTPDCTQVYRRDRGRKMLTCPSCFTSVCTGCNKEAHEGMTCEERELMNDPEEQERRNEQWALVSGAKRCPSCRVFLQKTEGCNHMECRCGAHFCWLCLQAFSGPGPVYEHMNRVHGGINTADTQQEQRAREQTNLLYTQRLQREENERAGARLNVLTWAGIQQEIRRAQVLTNATDTQQERRAREQADLLYAQRLQREEDELAGVDVANWRQGFDDVWRTQQELGIQRAQEEREREEARREIIQQQWRALTEERVREQERRQRQAAAQARAREGEQRQGRSSWCVIM
ncbi:hypothetical protein APHAL10511_001534 [Amanita phalloides]|nr:hypothetical protein APHAL10511_001534 [Amanita phalloides]